MDLDGRGAVVTGASRGIGSAIAKVFASAGASVAVHFHERADDAKAVAAENESAGGRALAIGADLRVSVHPIGSPRGPRGIRVNAVSPGLIWREGIERSWPEGVETFRRRAPLRRLGRPEEVAHACLFLASSASSFVTGANLVVDGGALAAPAF
jgi:NAD(P)-dependent dehydrogenase (short-subunit alcohol dehydrogenase family)